MFFLHEFITRSALYSEVLDILGRVDETDIVGSDEWVKHPDVELDHSVDVFYRELMSWVKKRRSGSANTQTIALRERIYWPPYPQPQM